MTRRRDADLEQAVRREDRQAIRNVLKMLVGVLALAIYEATIYRGKLSEIGHVIVLGVALTTMPFGALVLWMRRRTHDWADGVQAERDAAAVQRAPPPDDPPPRPRTGRQRRIDAGRSRAPAPEPPEEASR
ncbi:MAG: hypothetical protein JNL82_29865 [Myxococcales bacterium]|nr:hypothetical protein [Myxococcales bacterium]